MNRVIDDLETLLESAELDGEDEYANELRKAIEILKNHK
jgi:hypothetical protein